MDALRVSSTEVLIVSAVVVAAMAVKAGLDRTSTPALVGYLGIGLALKLIDTFAPFLTPTMLTVFRFLAAAGVLMLLFRIGLESNVFGLARQLRRASGIWACDLAVSILVAYVTARYLLGMSLPTSAFVSVAWSATSVGVPLNTWRQFDLVHTPRARLLLDVSELDDVSGVVVLAVLLAVMPIVGEAPAADVLPIGLRVGWSALARVLLLGVCCFIFARYLERPLVRIYNWIDPSPRPMVLMVSIGGLITGLAGLLKFSLAIGAFFGGLVFSREKQADDRQRSFKAIYNLIGPFFFVNIGLTVQWHWLREVWPAVLVLLAAAMLGKLIGAGGPAAGLFGWKGGLLFGLSMTPRAEITLVVLRFAQQLGDWAMPPSVFAAMVMATVLTCLLSPPLIGLLLRRWRGQLDGASG